MRLFNPSRVPKPLSVPLLSPTLFVGPTDLEIGAGQGLHAVRYCRDHRDRQLIALERTHNKFARLQQRKNHHPNLENLYIAHADAINFVCHFVPAESLERIFLLYPNPYPKTAHAQRRWHRSPFMSFLMTRLRPKGELNLATNLSWYRDEAIRHLGQEHPLTLVHEVVLTDPSAARTHFEKKYLERGETCFDLIFKKGLQ